MKKLNYQIMIDQCIKHGKLIRPIEVIGNYARARYGADHTSQYCAYLDKLGVKYEIGNDAPRGGAIGKFIKVIPND